MTATTLLSPVRLALPRASRFLLNGVNRLLDAFEDNAAARAQRQLRIEQAGRIKEAAAVRDYAARFAAHDPRFAADLLAAADRHERMQ